MERQAQLEQRRSLVVSVVRAAPLDVAAWLDGETMAAAARSGARPRRRRGRADARRGAMSRLRARRGCGFPAAFGSAETSTEGRKVEALGHGAHRVRGEAAVRGVHRARRREARWAEARSWRLQLPVVASTEQRRGEPRQQRAVASGAGQGGEAEGPPRCYRGMGAAARRPPRCRRPARSGGRGREDGKAGWRLGEGVGMGGCRPGSFIAGV